MTKYKNITRKKGIIRREKYRNLDSIGIRVELRKRMFARRSLSLYGGHEDEVNCLVFSKDLEILLTASISGVIRLWNTVFEHLTLKIHEKAGISMHQRIFKDRNNRNISLI